MNNTKWEELRSSMYALATLSPQWRTRTLGSGHVSAWDSEWFYHFKAGGYEDIEWVEIRITSEAQKNKVLSQLKRIHVPGHETDNGFKVYGYAESNQIVNYI
jgi:hypothetical protein